MSPSAASTRGPTNEQAETHEIHTKPYKPSPIKASNKPRRSNIPRPLSLPLQLELPALPRAPLGFPSPFRRYSLGRSFPISPKKARRPGQVQSATRLLRARPLTTTPGAPGGLASDQPATGRTGAHVLG